MLLVIQRDAALNNNMVGQAKEIFAQGEGIEESMEEVEGSNGLTITKPHKPVMSMV